MDAAVHHPVSLRRPPRAGTVWLVVVLAGLVLYMATCQRGVSWQDSGMYQWRVAVGDYTGRLGLALAHPLYIAMGRLMGAIPFGTLPGRLNLLSGVGMALALGNLAGAVIALTGRRWAGGAAAALLAVSHTPWWLATVAEVYTWSLAGLMAEVWLLAVLLRRPRWDALAVLALINGLGLCIHNVALLSLPVYVVVAVWLVARRKLPVWALVVAGLAWLVGSSMYLAMIAELAGRTGDWPAALRSALVGEYGRQVLNIGRASPQLKANLALILMNFVSLMTPLAVIGWMVLPRRAGRPTTVALAALTAIHVLFVARYPVPDQFTFMLPTLGLLAVVAGVAAAELGGDRPARRSVVAGLVVLSVVFQPVLYAVAPGAIRSAGRAPARQRNLPFRDELRYWLVPWKHNETSAQRFALTALQQARPDGVILAAETSRYPLMVAQKVYGLAPNVTIIRPGGSWPVYSQSPHAFRAALGDRNLYVVTTARAYLPDQLADDADFSRGANQALYWVIWADNPWSPRTIDPDAPSRGSEADGEAFNTVFLGTVLDVRRLVRGAPVAVPVGTDPRYLVTVRIDAIRPGPSAVAPGTEVTFAIQSPTSLFGLSGLNEAAIGRQMKFTLFGERHEGRTWFYHMEASPPPQDR